MHTIGGEDSDPEEAPAATPKRKKKVTLRKKGMKVHTVPTFDPSIGSGRNEDNEGTRAMSRTSPGSSPDHSPREVPDDASQRDDDMDDTVEIPSDPGVHASPTRTPKKKRAKKNRHVDADEGDDESVADDPKEKDSDSESDEDEENASAQAKGVRIAGGSGKEKDEDAEGDTEIPMEGERGIPKPGGRLARFKLQRGNPNANRTFGSRIMWGGGNSSFDEGSPDDGVELTPLELARIQATMRRVRGHNVPDIYGRPKNVVEAALMPGTGESGIGAGGSAYSIGHNRRPYGSKTSLEGDEDDYEELGNFDDRGSVADYHNYEDTPPPLPILVPKYPLEELIPFLTLLAKTFHSYGAAVNRTEWNLREVSEVLGVTANYSVMPTQITITFGLPEGMDAVSRTFRCDQNLVECGKLYSVERLIDRIRLQTVDLYQARDELTAIVNRPPTFSRPIRLLALALGSASSAVLFFNGGWIEFLAAFVLGFIVALLDWLAEHLLAFARIEEIVCGLIVAAVAVPVTYFVEGACFSGLVLSSLVWLLPGLTLTLSVRELATKNMVAGTVRMFSAFMTSLKLGFGIAFGSYIPFWFPRSTITAACGHPLSQWWLIPMFFTTNIPFNILLGTSVSQWPGQLITAGVGFIISWSFSKYVKLPAELISVLAAFGVGLVGNGYALFSRSPGVIYIVSGILLVRQKHFTLLDLANCLLRPDRELKRDWIFVESSYSCSI